MKENRPARPRPKISIAPHLISLCRALPRALSRGLMPASVMGHAPHAMHTLLAAPEPDPHH